MGPWEPSINTLKEDISKTSYLLASPVLAPLSPARVAILWSAPSDWRSEEVENSMSRHIGRYLAARKLTLNILEGVKEQTKEVFDRIDRTALAIGLWDDDILNNRALQILNEKVSNETVGAKYLMGEDYSWLKTTYPDGRETTHHFLSWPDGVVRCDCKWKRFNWSRTCKHEKVRESLINGK